MNDITSIQSQLRAVMEYLMPRLPLANCHMVNFITGNVWEVHVPSNIRAETEQIGISSLYSMFSNYSTRNEECSIGNAPFLARYFSAARENCLSSMGGLVLSPPELYEKVKLWGCQKQGSLHLEEFMSRKKTHEVEMMSEVVAALTTCCASSHIVDVGGGKGYLSSMLALHHGLQVLGVDCSQINTHSAAKRTERLQKVWKGLCRRLDQVGHGETPPRHGKHWKSKNTPETYESDSNNSIDNHCESGSYKQATEFVTDNTNVDSLIAEYLPNSSCTGVTLTGLHTCGNLASTCIHLFVKNKLIKCLCNVGCCYHLIEEEFSKNPFWYNENPQEVACGFPMSQYLTSLKFGLGRNARMLAAQSLDRISEKGQVPVQSLFYRALLQVILIQKYGQELPNWQVGRIASKSQDFCDYVRKALKKLKLDVQLSTSEIEALYEKYTHKQEELEKFFLLRVTLAPVIETVILLDRLLYLHEQGLHEAYLVQLFDPVVSPRCYGLIAVKSQYLLHS